MSLSNKDILADNRQQTLDFAKKIATNNNSPKSLDEIKQLAETRRTEARIAFERGEINEAILKLNEAKDNKIGISWSISEPSQTTGTRSLVRDARNIIDDETEIAKEFGENYLIQILSQCRCAKDLMQDVTTQTPETLNELRDKLDYIAKKAFNDIDELPNKIEHYNARIIEILNIARIKNPEEELVFAKQIDTIRPEHFHIATLSTIQDEANKKHTIIEADVILQGLTETQQEQLGALKNANPKRAYTVAGQEWFNQIKSQYKRKMIAKVATELATGHKVISSQFLNYLPGLRNAYEKTSALINDNNELKIIAQNFHSATPASTNKIEGNSFAHENIRQLELFADNFSINLNILNSKILNSNNIAEGKFFKQIQSYNDSSENQQILITATPINDLHKIPGSGKDISGFKDYLKEIGKGISEGERNNELQNIAQFLEHGQPKFYDEANQEIADLAKDDKELANLLKECLKLRRLMKNNPWVGDNKGKAKASGSNLSETIASGMNTIQTALRIENNPLAKLLPNLKEKIATRAESCKSGKDRTGHVQLNNTYYAACVYLGIEESSPARQKINRRLTNNGHAQDLTAKQGGTLGAEGIKQSGVFKPYK